jgi:predicted nucleic acid-binding protein
MNRIFLDATVLFAAAHSSTGASRELFALAKAGRIELITNEIAVEETERNLLRKAPDGLSIFKALMETQLITVIPAPTKEEVLAAAAYTALKDAPIVAGAIAAQADYLVTFDRKHLLNPPEVAEKSSLVIATPGEALEFL